MAQLINRPPIEVSEAVVAAAVLAAAVLAEAVLAEAVLAEAVLAEAVLAEAVVATVMAMLLQRGWLDLYLKRQWLMQINLLLWRPRLIHNNKKIVNMIIGQNNKIIYYNK